jgi:hypothetical protein
MLLDDRAAACGLVRAQASGSRALNRTDRPMRTAGGAQPVERQLSRLLRVTPRRAAACAIVNHSGLSLATDTDADSAGAERRSLSRSATASAIRSTNAASGSAARDATRYLARNLAWPAHTLPDVGVRRTTCHCDQAVVSLVGREPARAPGTTHRTQDDPRTIRCGRQGPLWPLFRVAGSREQTRPLRCRTIRCHTLPSTHWHLAGHRSSVPGSV